MRWWWVLLVLVVSPAFGQQLAREGTTTTVDLTFSNAAGQDELPSSLTYRLDDVASQITLLTSQSIGTPASQPCLNSVPGCVSVILPASALKVVGQCSNKHRACLVDGDCGTGGTCRTPNELTQDAAMTVEWTYPGGQGKDRLILRILNLAAVQ